MHSLEQILVILSHRIRRETGNNDLADETMHLASASHDYEVSSDLASLLTAEFAEWFQTLGAKGVLPRAFTGASKGGKQAVVILSGLPPDHVQRREFLNWLCRTEEFVAYAYGTQVGIADESSAVTEGLDIYASSSKYDISKTLRIERQAGGSTRRASWQ